MATVRLEGGEQVAAELGAGVVVGRESMAAHQRGFADPHSRGKKPTGDLVGYWQYRIGAYRVLVEVRDDDLVIIAITLGHRSGIY